MIKKLTHTLLFLFLALTLTAQEHKNVLSGLSAETGLIIKDDITRLLIHNSSGDLAHDYVSQIALWDRQQSTKGYNEAATWVEGKAKAFGLQDVLVETYKSDGKTSYFGDTPQPYWIVKKGELWSLEPYNYKITSYADLPMSLAQNSYSKKAKAQLVDIGAGTPKDYEGKELKGKIVLTSGSPYRAIRAAVYEKGAIGVISHYSVPYWDKTNRLEGDFPDQVGWSGTPKTEEKDKQTFAFMISQRKAKELREVLRAKDSINLFVDIETSYDDSDFGIVSGVIKGSKYPDEEIIITSHIDHYKPGANDNASGSAVSLEIARTLNQLIAEGKISRPLRTIRFLWLPEFTGTKAWFSRHINEKKTRILNLNLDMLGSNLKASNSNYSISYTPDWNASYINAISSSIVDFLNAYNNVTYPKRKDYNIISVNGSRNPVNAKVEAYTRGSDHQIFNDFGIPGIIYGTWPDNFYHSSEDTPDKVDPTQLHRVAFTGLATIMVAAYADKQNVDDIMNLVELHGQKRLKNDIFEARKSILSTNTSNLSNQAYFAQKAIENAFERENKSLESCLLFSEEESAQLLLKKKLQANDKRKASMLNDLNELVKSIDSGVSVKPYSSSEKKAAEIIPIKNKGKELNSFSSTYSILGDSYREKYIEVYRELDLVLDALREREVGELRIYQFEDVISSYSNGKRSLVDIRDALFAEYKIEVPISLVSNLFELLEKSGVVTYIKK